LRSSATSIWHTFLDAVGTMSAIAAVLPGPADGITGVEPMLSAMAPASGGRSSTLREGRATLGVVAAPWEEESSLGRLTSLATGGQVSVAAAASLYYRADLRRDLAAHGSRPGADTPAALILEAYRAWGPACAERLEGDFAFVLFDEARGVLVAARDFAGRRPLHFARIGGGVAVASTVAGVLAHSRCRRDLNLVALAEDAAGLTGSPTETAFRDVFRVPAGHILVVEQGKEPRLGRYWHAVPTDGAGRTSFEEGAHHLRGLLRDAVRERLPETGLAAISLSGGWDSPAVYAAARSLPGEDGTDTRIRPVSISYPKGDPGREDEVIDAILAHWNASTRWVAIDHIPFWPDFFERGAARDEPFAHAFEDWNRVLFDAAREEGTRVILDGYGGDQLFQVSSVFLADLARRGAVRELTREWRDRGMSLRDRSAWLQWVLIPLVPELVRDAARRRGHAGALASHLERALPGWLSAEFVRRNSLVERERAHNPVRWHGDRSLAEMRWYLENPFFPRVLSSLGRLAGSAGVEARSPLFDRRVVEFALQRPRWERASARQTKRLLREAVRELLPDWTLAPRRWRTGTTEGYLSRSLTAVAPQIEEVLRRPVLAELGIADGAALRRRIELWRQSGETDAGLELFAAAQTECWLRSRVGGEEIAESCAATAAR
jgi:asparagine synthase (glutamine-hydrolysing)